MSYQPLPPLLPVQHGAINILQALGDLPHEAAAGEGRLMSNEGGSKKMRWMWWKSRQEELSDEGADGMMCWRWWQGKRNHLTKVVARKYFGCEEKASGRSYLTKALTGR